MSGSSNTNGEDAHATTLQSDVDDEGLRYVQAQVSTMLQKSARSPTPPTARQAGQHEWAFAPEDQLTARFGQTLFPLDSSAAGPESVSATSFVPSLPGLAKILVDEDFKLGRGPSAPIFEYTFVAAPEQQNFTKDQEFPTLRVQFAYNEHTGLHFLKKLHLYLDERVHDVLLPDKSLDIRFHRRTRLRLHAPHTNKMVEDFQRTVITNIQSGGKLTAPNLKLDIPRWAIPGYLKADLSGTRSVLYLFTGIRFRQSVPARFMDNQITVSTTQSGKLGSKSAALSTYWDPQEFLNNSENRSRVQQGGDLKEFVAGCFKIVDKITMAAASNEQRLRRFKPRDEMSARKIRRQELQAVSRDGDAAEENVEQVGSSATEGRTGQEVAEFSEQLPTTMSQHLNTEEMQDPYLSTLLTQEEISTDQQDRSSFAREGIRHDSPEQEDGQSLKTAA
jgi:hypothetical protein